MREMETSAPGSAPGRPVGATFRHDAMLYAGDEQFVAAAASFVRDALEHDEAMLVAVIEPRASLLREELGTQAKAVEFLDMWNVGRNPARIIPAWQQWVERHQGSGRGFRGIGEPIWAARSPAELIECQQHEQLLNVAFDDGAPWWLLCPYDTANLPKPVITRAYDTHPQLMESEAISVPGAVIRSHSYPHAELTPNAMFAAPLADPEPSAMLYQAEFVRTELPLLRHELAARAAALGLGPRRTEDLVLVADELAANSVCHGGGRGTLRFWREGRGAVCEVRDRGLVTDPLIGRRRPALAEGKGAGLWIANQLCDLVQIRSTPELGTVVRAHFTEPGSDAA
jgi:anti-sigma regulatory factor (Ser/Thr protein kinase)